MCIRDSPTALHHQPHRVRLELPAELPPLAHANTLSPFHGLLQVSTLSRQVQVMDFNTCEVFDYPDLRPFQAQVMRLNKERPKTAEELAGDAGCGSPKVLTKPVPLVSQR